MRILERENTVIVLKNVFKELMSTHDPLEGNQVRRNYPNWNMKRIH
jgi:hypothetical protein